RATLIGEEPPAGAGEPRVARSAGALEGDGRAGARPAGIASGTQTDGPASVSGGPRYASGLAAAFARDRLRDDVGLLDLGPHRPPQGLGARPRRRQSRKRARAGPRAVRRPDAERDPSRDAASDAAHAEDDPGTPRFIDRRASGAGRSPGDADSADGDTDTGPP